MQEFALEHPWMVFFVALTIAGGFADLIGSARAKRELRAKGRRCKQHIEGD